MVFFRPVQVVSLLGASLALVLASATTAGAQSSGWTPGPGAVLDNTYQGVVDAPTSGAGVPNSGTLDVHGWFVDTTAQGWAGADNVQVFLGQMDSGGTMLGQGAVAESRPDVATALGNPFWSDSGFDVQFPASSLPAGNQTLSVYLHTPGKGWWFLQVPVNVGAAPAAAPAAAAAPAPAAAGAATGAPQVAVTQPTEGANVSTQHGDYTIQGTATEPGIGPSDIDHIEIWLDGERNSGSLLGTVTPASDGTWSVTFTPTHFASTHSNIYVYAHSRSTKQETEIIRGFNITDRP